jgi:S-adenosylmethionine decarboxylase
MAQHLTCEAIGCAVDLRSAEAMERALRSAAARAGATVVAEAAHAYHGGGLTMVLLCAESHLLISTWPEADYALVEVLLCGEAARPDLAAEVVKGALRAAEWRVHASTLELPPASYSS